MLPKTRDGIINVINMFSELENLRDFIHDEVFA